MKNLISAQAEFEKTERELRSLASRSLLFGNYQESERLIQLAQLMHEMAENVGKGNFDFLNQFGNRAPGHAVPQESKKIYPCFSRKGEYLNRTGWSKKFNKEYHQKIPFEVVNVVCRILPDLQKSKSPFQIPDIYPLAVLPDNRKAKDYQVYMSIGWLKSEGLIKHHGDEGYQLVDPDGFVEKMTRSWGQLQ